MEKFRCLIACCFLWLPLSHFAQDTAPPAAKEEDVQSLDNIIEALYGVISGEKGQARDWNRFLSLFKPGAQLIPSGPDGENKMGIRFMSPQDYADRSGPWLEENGFFENEIAREELHFGSMTHIWSTYESRRSARDPQPFARGINSIQLINDGERWWIVNIYWTAEREDLPIPKKFLPQ